MALLDAGRLPPHPAPPADLEQRPLPILETAADWYRIHGERLAPLFFGRSGRNRFDAPGGEYGVLYAGADAYCAFVETFGHATGIRLVHADELRSRRLSRIRVPRPLRLVDLTGAGLARIGADARLRTGDYLIAQRWSQALHAHPLNPDGLLYRSRHDPSRQCVAIFERASTSLEVAPMGSLADPGLRPLLADVLDHYQFGLLGDLRPATEGEIP